MEYRHLGRLGLRVSPLCLGTMNFGPQTSEPDSHAIMDRALELGINFFDTANVYGQRKGVGATETIVGNWFAKGDGRRDKVVLATKVYSEMGTWPNESRLSALHIRKACEDSLRRLQTDHIDLYQMHHVYREAPWDEIWQAFETLVQQGKVIYVGSSNFAGWHIAKANEAAKARHFLGLVSEQCIYNLAERNVELEVLPACEDYGMGVIPWSPLWRGLARRRAGGGRLEGDPARVDHGAGRARGAPSPGGGVREVLCRTRPAAGGGRARVVAREPGGHGADHRPADPRTARERDAGAGVEARRGHDETSRRDLAGSGRARARSVRLVGTDRRASSTTSRRTLVPSHPPAIPSGVMEAKDGRPVEDPDDLTDEERDVVLRVVEVLRRIEFGTILLVVQDGKVVQIEMAEKFRLR